MSWLPAWHVFHENADKAGDLNITTHSGFQGVGGRLDCKSLIKQDMAFQLDRQGGGIITEKMEKLYCWTATAELIQRSPWGARRGPKICLAVSNILFKQIALVLLGHLRNGRYCQQDMCGTAVTGHMLLSGSVSLSQKRKGKLEDAWFHLTEQLER